MKIRTCPFCGGEIERHRDSYYIDHKSSCFLFRNHVNFINKNELEAWNRREPMDKIVEQLEAEEYDVNCNICDYDSEIDTNTFQYYEGKEDGIREAIEIVKGGVV